MVTSGYRPCACRDCFEIAIGDDDEAAMCHECESAGCEPDSECCCEPEMDFSDPIVTRPGESLIEAVRKGRSSEPELLNDAGDPVTDTSEGCVCGGSHIVEIGDVDGAAAARNCTRCLPAIVGAALAAQHYGGGDLSRYIELPLLNRAKEIGLLK